MSNNGQPLDLAAHAEQQKIERQAREHGLEGAFPELTGINVQGGFIIAAELTTYAICSTCGASIRHDMWERHAKWHARYVEVEVPPTLEQDPNVIPLFDLPHD